MLLVVVSSETTVRFRTTVISYDVLAAHHLLFMISNYVDKIYYYKCLLIVQRLRPTERRPASSMRPRRRPRHYD